MNRQQSLRFLICVAVIVAVLMPAGIARASTPAKGATMPGLLSKPAVAQYNSTNITMTASGVGRSILTRKVSRPSSSPAGTLERCTAPPDMFRFFYESFWPAMHGWRLSGSPTWAGTTYDYVSPNRSGYCAGSIYSAPGPYVNYMNAWMTRGPYSTADWQSCGLNYSYSVNTEQPSSTGTIYDYLFVGLSANGSSYGGMVHSGDSAGWRAVSIDYPSLGRKPTIYPGINFRSDYSNSDEGAYVDDVYMITNATMGKPVVPASYAAGYAFVVRGIVTDSMGNHDENTTARLYFDKKNSLGQWVRVTQFDTTIYATTNGYRKSVVAYARGSWRMRAYHRCWNHSSGYSPYAYFKIY